MRRLEGTAICACALLLQLLLLAPLSSTADLEHSTAVDAAVSGCSWSEGKGERSRGRRGGLMRVELELQERSQVQAAKALSRKSRKGTCVRMRVQGMA